MVLHLEIIFYRIPYISLFLIIFFLNYKRLTVKKKVKSLYIKK